MRCVSHRRWRLGLRLRLESPSDGGQFLQHARGNRAALTRYWSHSDSAAPPKASKPSGCPGSRLVLDRAPCRHESEPENWPGKRLFLVARCPDRAKLRGSRPATARARSGPSHRRFAVRLATTRARLTCTSESQPYVLDSLHLPQLPKVPRRVSALSQTQSGTRRARRQEVGHLRSVCGASRPGSKSATS